MEFVSILVRWELFKGKVMDVGDFVINEGIRYQICEVVAENELAKYQSVWCVDETGGEFEFKWNELEAVV
jgi:hypothetical protein